MSHIPQQKLKPDHEMCKSKITGALEYWGVGVLVKGRVGRWAFGV
jgi:hypothetical protein